MTAQILAAELANLIQDSKRKNSELRNAAEKSHQDLKSLSVTSEAQLSADLSRRPHFITPFLIACSTHNAKFGTTGVSCLQRLSVARALPRERLTEVLDALKESVSLSHDVQLKILQALPPLIQNYPAEIRGDLLSNILQVCSALQNAKNFAVSNTAAATLQQLIIAIFDRVAAEDEKSLEIPTVAELPGDDGPVAVRPAAQDACKVFNDLNLLVTGEKPTFVRIASIPPTTTLEVIEAILSNHVKIMTTHAELIHIMRTLLMPTIIRSLSERLPFPITLRIIRILNLLIRNQLSIMPSECEIALGLLNHMLDPEASTLWKRALCLEVFRGIYSDSHLLLQIYSHFDIGDGKKSIFGDNLAAFVRLATEKPAIIGLGQQSTTPASRTEGKEMDPDQAVAEAGALAGVIGPVSEANAPGQHTGISSQWSTLKTPCIEHLDKSEAPALPETYVYSLVLTCITNVSESLAKFVLPLTVHHDGRNKKKSKSEENEKIETDSTSGTPVSNRLSRTQSFRTKTVPVNPLSLEDHHAFTYIQTSAKLVTNCWPAVLATCSTFLNASLDADYYRALVRAIQKFTQVAGLLRLATPRDAFLTTLAKAAVPSSMLLNSTGNTNSHATEQAGVSANKKMLLSVDSLVSQASSALEKNRRSSHESNSPSLGPRNLLCLRALVNLAIALGPTLQSAWSIVFETLQVADLVMAISNQSGGRIPSGSKSRADSDSATEKVEAETAAVQAAARRLFESTVDYPNESMVEVLQALCALVNTSTNEQSGEQTPKNTHRPSQRRLGSVSNIKFNPDSESRDSAFALNKIGELAGLNEERLANFDPSESGWDVLVAELVRISATESESTSTRLLAAEILSRTVKDIAHLSIAETEREAVQARVLSALQAQISSLYQQGSDRNMHDDANIRIHQITLEALKSVIEQCGESLVAGWSSVLNCLLSVFLSSSTGNNDGSQSSAVNGGSLHPVRAVKVISKALARSAFGTVQLICSDFLAAVPDTCLSTLLELLLRFSCQQEDLNMSLTAVTFFWNVSDFLHSRSDLSKLPAIIGDVKSQDSVREAVQHKSQEGAVAALWLRVLLDLSAITTDKRAEVRNSAIQTIQRIFENYVDQLSPDAWMLCLRSVLFGMIEANLAVQNSIRGAAQKTDDDVVAWNDTTKTILDAVCTLISTYLDKVDDADRLGEAWTDLLDYFQQYFLCFSHALGASVFNTITRVLSRIEDASKIGHAPLLKTSEIWRQYYVDRAAWSNSTEGNQDALVAYTNAFKAIYKLIGSSLSGKEVIDMLRNLEACVIDSDEVAYSSDIDRMTVLQTRVIECFYSVRLDGEGLPEFISTTLSNFITLPYVSLAENPGRKGPTFVALSKAAMSLLETVIYRHVANPNMYNSGAYLTALTSLAKPIREKYVWHREGKNPTIWQKATTTAFACLKPSLKHVNELPADQLKEIWEQIVIITSGITEARLSPTNPLPSSLEADENFDMDQFTQFRDLITQSLGSSSLSDTLRRTYTRCLFQNSVIHTPISGEIPDLAQSPLEDLYAVRLGRTDTASPSPRTEMAYLCLSELFSLVSHHSLSKEDIKLAKAAAPYFILRTALPLRAYIADDPLRGRMPQPDSQRRELLFVLRELAALHSEPAAIPDAPGVQSEWRKHLHRLYPLLMKAVRVARNDDEVFEGVVRLLDIVGDEFGVVDE